MTKVMNNPLLPALLWALFIAPLAAQKALPPSLQPHAHDWSPSVSKVLHYAGFELPAMAMLPETTEPTVQGRANPLRLDSTKTFHGYNLGAPGDSTPLFRTTYAYPQPSVKVETNFQYENGTWITLNRVTLFSDQRQRVKEVVAETYDPVVQDFLPDSRIVAFPHGDSPVDLDSFFTYQWDSIGMAWSLLVSSANTFDAQDRLIESVSTLLYLGDPVYFKDVYTYDAQGDNTVIESVALFSGAEFPSGRQEITYKNHLPVEVVALTPDALGGYLPQNKTTYTYTAFNKEEQVDSYAWRLDLSDWFQTERNTYSYDALQRVTAKETLFVAEDGTEDRERIGYAYIEDENLSVETTFLWDGQDFYLSDRKYYYYDNGFSAAPEPVRATLPLVVSPNPTVDQVRLQLDEPALVYLYNTQGALLYSIQYQASVTLDVSGLPNGLYFITARSEKALYNGRMVKQ